MKFFELRQITKKQPKYFKCYNSWCFFWHDYFLKESMIPNPKNYFYENN